jgi:diguanylate cyclase (GGDEF)-like protein
MPTRTAPSSDFQSRIAAASNLPSPPAVAARLIDIANSPDIVMTEVVDVLRTDAALSAKLLRLANSPLYACRRHIGTLQQAVMMLGLDAVLTASLSLTLICDHASMGYTKLSFRAYWRRSVYSAVSAQMLARRCPGAPCADAFLAALLQDIGILVIARVEPDAYAALLATDTHEQIAAVEMAALGTDHAEIGASLLESWNLPKHIVTAVRGSHDMGPGDSPLAAIVAVSGLLADAIDGNPIALTAAADAALQLGVDDNSFSAMIADIADALPDLAPVLNASPPPADTLAQMAAEVIMGRLINSRAETDRLRHDLNRAESLATEMQRQNDLDPLTQSLSRRALERALAEQFGHYERFGWAMTVLFVDIDEFKSVNDQFGHQGGDHVLNASVAMIRSSLRDGDIVGRFGGDEFLVILPGVGSAEGAIVANRIVERFRRSPIANTTGPPRVQTVSIGIASSESLEPRATVQDLLACADAALYEVKHNGRDGYATATARL